MNLFRSEEHVRNWNGYKPGTDEGIVRLDDMVRLFSVETFTRRMDPDYVSRIKEYRAGRNAAWAEIMKRSPFWMPRQ
ncbi:MAG TPA: hypothetical protein VLS90_11595 [Thermodesulfobacteriota bacterium]|nr:hypothetical protein [Thermodesulfobacteriota bacterium]